MKIREKEIANLEDEVARPAISNRNLLTRSQTIEDRQTHAKQRDAKPFGRLPPM
jgi:hypothetical protein